MTNGIIHKLDEDWDEDKDRIENNVADFPEDAARWTGEKVGNILFRVISNYNFPRTNR